MSDNEEKVLDMDIGLQFDNFKGVPGPFLFFPNGSWVVSQKFSSPVPDVRAQEERDGSMETERTRAAKQASRTTRPVSWPLEKFECIPNLKHE